MSGAFGWAVSLRDGRLVIGAPSDSTVQSRSGAAFVYLRSGTSWISEAVILPPPTSPSQALTGAYYGTTVGVSGNLLVMGAPQADAGKEQNGAALLYERQNSSWLYRSRLTAPDGGSYDFLGTSLDIDNGIALAGAPGHDGLGKEVGAAYLFSQLIPDPGPPPGNAAPTASFTHSCSFRTCQFDGSASKDSDGSIVRYEWLFGDGSSAVGAKASHTYLTDASVQVRLTVTDDEGAVGRAYLNLTIRGEATFNLTVTGYLDRGMQTALLTWTGTSAASVDVYRNSLKVATVPNSGSYVDRTNQRGSGSKTYRICETGGTACSNTVTVYFQ
jgi:hypothetical protein